MFIKSTLTRRDFIEVNFILLYSKIGIKIFTGITALLLLLSFITAASLPNGQAFLIIFLSFLMLVFLPLVTYFSAIRNFTTRDRIGETMEYHFGDEYFVVKGESFNSQLTWEKIFKVTQTKNWILIWHNRQYAHPIKKGNVSTEQISYLKKTLDKLKVKNNL